MLKRASANWLQIHDQALRVVVMVCLQLVAIVSVLLTSIGLPTAARVIAQAGESEAPVSPRPTRPPGGPETHPPVIYLRLGDDLLSGALGPYCWTTTDPSLGRYCADPFPVPQEDEPIQWPVGQPVQIEVDGPVPRTLSIRVRPPYRGRPLPELLLQERLVPGLAASWTPALPPGRYVLSIFGTWAADPEARLLGGDVTYVFLIELQPIPAP